MQYKQLQLITIIIIIIIIIITMFLNCHHIVSSEAPVTSATDYGVNVSCQVPVQLRAYAGNNLYCLVTEATWCEKLA